MEIQKRSLCSKCDFSIDCMSDKFEKECPCKQCILKVICRLCCEQAHIYFSYRVRKEFESQDKLK